MAITATQRTDIVKIVVGLFNAAPGATYLNSFAAYGDNLAGLTNDLVADPAFTAIYPEFLTSLEFGTKFVDALVGNAAAAADKAWAAEWIAGMLDAGNSRAEVVTMAVTELQGAAGNAKWAAAATQFANKVAVAEYYSVDMMGSATDVGALQGVIANVTATTDVSSDAALEAAVNGGAGGENGQTFTLTQNADSLTGNAGANVFVAPVTQNGTGSGQLANTFETGDVLDGAAGRDVLRADLIDSGSISDGSFAPAISATTSGIEEVYLRAQTPQSDFNVNVSTIDAEKMAGVEQWWTDNSRTNIQIEDIRTDTTATTFGMRLTDPGVGYATYFNALFLEGDNSATSAMTLNIYEGPLGSPNTTTELANITVREITFTVAGEQFTLDTPAIRAADTWGELETALNEALAAIPGSEGITLINRGNGQFVFEDSEGREFQVNEGEALVLSVTNNITVTNSLAVGREEVTGPVISNAVLDGAGNGSQGGALNIGAMSGLRGVEELNLSVDRDSHVTSITSFNLTPGQYVAKRDGSANEHLEVVDVTSIGAEGDLTVGRTNPNAIDGRVLTWSNAGGLVNGVADSGFVNLRELNTGDFNGALNVAVTLDNNTISRYLDSATEAVTFSYDGGAQNDIFNIADVSTLGVSGDQDFAMEVDMGAGDDRLVLTGFTARAVSVDGGEGENSIVVAQSHGTTTANTFEAFANFQTYEVEGNGNTVHDFTSMSGIENVVIATGVAAPNTQLRDLEAAQNVTVSGKNQTVGNASTADQNFGTIQLTNDAGTDRTITLDNTARLSNSTNGVRQDGVLTVNNLTIDTNPVTNVGATRAVTIESAGERTSANAIAQFNGRDVETLTLTGTQDLTINVATIADQATNTAPGTNTSTSVQVSAAGLTGNLNLALNGAMLNNFGATPPVPAQTDRVVGTAGTNDNVMFYGALSAGNALTASAIERVQLGSFGDEFLGVTGLAVNAAGVATGGSATTMLGDLAENREVSGALNVANLGTNNFVIANVDNAALPPANADLQLTNLTSGATITLGDAARNIAGDRVASQELTETLAFSSQATTAAQTAAELTLVVSGVVENGGVNAMNLAVGDQVTNQAGVLATANTGGFRTINLDIERDITIGSTAADTSTINLLVGSQARTLDVDGGLVGKANDATADTLVLGNQLLNSLEVVNLSGYNGQVTLTMQQGVIADPTETDVAFVMSGYNANITLSNEAVAATAHNSTFDFNTAGTVAVPSVWTIDNIVGFNVVGATINNATLFDLRDLGINNFAQVEVIYGDGLTTFALDGVTVLAVGEATVRSEAQGNDGTETWEIIVTGVAPLGAGDIAAGNFVF